MGRVREKVSAKLGFIWSVYLVSVLIITLNSLKKK